MKNLRLRKTISLFLCLIMLALPGMISSCAGDGGDGTGTSAGSGTTAETDAPGTEEIIDPSLIVTPDSVNIDTKITISPLNASTNNDGLFQGWGTSLCWWANRIGYSDTLSQLAADLFYGDDGLRLNIMRYNIGGGDDPTHHHITRTDSAIPGWLVWDETKGDYVYDYDADKNQLNVLKRAVDAAGDNALVEVFSNSPPYFMTNSGCSSGNTDANVNNLKLSSYEEFAEYLAHVTNYIQNTLGIKVASVAPMNEPNTNYWGAYSDKQEGCHFDAGSAQSKIITLTAEALRQYDLDNVIISASDETSTWKQIEEYHSYSPDAKAVIGRINTHSYDTSNIAELGQLARDEDFVLWMSEVDGSGTAGQNAGEMGSALWFGEKIISDINGLSPSAWIMWQAIDNHISKDGYNGNKDFGMVDVNGGFWGLAVADHDKEDIILTQKYYGMGQFTRYIRPGYTLITCGSDSLAAYDRENGTLVVVAINPTSADKTADIDLSLFDKIGQRVKVVRTSGGTNGGEQWAELDDILAYDNGFVATLKANSITTYIMENVEMGEVTLDEISLKDATVTGSTPWNNGADVAANVVDGSLGSFFDGVEGGWLQIDLGDETEFDVLGFAPRSAYEGRMAGGIFYGSNDGENWTPIYTVEGTPAGGLNYVFLDSTCKYRFIRYSGPEGSADFLCNIAEIMLFKKA